MSGTLVVLELPPNWVFGIDLQMWGIGPNFSGISHVPNGVHYVYYSPPGELWRMGQFVTIENDMTVFRFDRNEERLVRQSNSLVKMYHRSGLAPFTQIMQREYDWEKLVEFVTRDLIRKLEKDDKIVFEPIPSLVIPTGSTPSDITRLGMDKSTHLNQFILSKKYTKGEVLGELQVAFILFFLGEDYEALLHWRSLLELFLQCLAEGICDSLELFKQFVRVLVAQVREIPSEVLTDVSSDGDVFLVPLIAQFIRECETKVDCRDLEVLMTEKFGGNKEWAQICDEDEPVVVDNSY